MSNKVIDYKCKLAYGYFLELVFEKKNLAFYVSIFA